jgi:protein-L-isoaspartate(D-aspartate) O-methyltransferase
VKRRASNWCEFSGSTTIKSPARRIFDLIVYNVDMEQATETSAQELMVRQQIIERGISDKRVIEAMRRVPRDQFFTVAPKDDAWADRAAPIGFGQTISQPYIVALMTERLDVQSHHKVLEIGTGSGYQTAILAKLAHEVFTIERVKPLLDTAFERLLGLSLRNVHFRHGDGTLGWQEQAPFDRILISAGAPEIPRNLILSQLRDDGIAVLPAGPLEEQMLLAVHREGDRLIPQEISPCRFVQLLGKEGWPVKE